MHLKRELDRKAADDIMAGETSKYSTLEPNGHSEEVKSAVNRF